MKRIVLACLLSFLMISNALFSQESNIFANVDGNIVTLWETQAQRNCGAFYEMTVDLNDHHMKWVQVDVGDIAVCLCVFDLSVTYGPLEPGDYTVDVYSTNAYETGEYFEGSTTFTIGNDRESEDGGIISQYQSNCYSEIGDTDPVFSESNYFKIYPIPVKEGSIINLEALQTADPVMLEIFTLTGKLVYRKHYEGNHPIRDQWMKEELFTVSGLYLVIIKTGQQVFTQKVPVF